MGCSLTKTIQLWEYPHGHGQLHVCCFAVNSFWFLHQQLKIHLLRMVGFRLYVPSVQNGHQLILKPRFVPPARNHNLKWCFEIRNPFKLIFWMIQGGDIQVNTKHNQLIIAFAQQTGWIQGPKIGWGTWGTWVWILLSYSSGGFT